MPRPQRRGAPCCRGTRRGVSSNGRPVRCCQRRRSRGNTGGGTAPCRLPGAPWRHPALAPPRLLHGARGGASVPHVSTSGGAGAGCTSDARGRCIRVTTRAPPQCSQHTQASTASRRAGHAIRPRRAPTRASGAERTAAAHARRLTSRPGPADLAPGLESGDNILGWRLE